MSMTMGGRFVVRTKSEEVLHPLYHREGRNRRCLNVICEVLRACCIVYLLPIVPSILDQGVQMV